MSEETRVESIEIMTQLQDLVKEVYETRSQPFHWDLKTDVETKTIPSAERGILEPDTDISAANELTYEVNSFVAVRHADAEDSNPFWIGKVSRVKKDGEGRIQSLRVQWFNTSRAGGDPYAPVYKSTNRTPHGIKFTIWTQEIDPQTLLVNFEGLKTDKRLSSETCKRIQEKVGSMG